MDTLAKINPLEYISPHDPVPQRLLNASRWFVVEVLELDFGDYVGRPSQHALVRVQLLSYLFSNGWYVDAVQNGGEGGNWQTVSQTDTDNTGTTGSTTHSGTVSNTSSKTNTQSNTQSETSSGTGSDTNSGTKSRTNSRTQNNSNSNTQSRTQNSTHSNSSSSTKSQTQNSSQSETSSSTQSRTQNSTSSQGSSQGSSMSNASSNSFASSHSSPWDAESRQAISHGSATSNSSGLTKAHTEEHTQTNSSTSTQTNSNTSSQTNSSTSTRTNSHTSSQTNSSTSSQTSSHTSSQTSSSTSSQTSSHTSSQTSSHTSSQTSSETSTASHTNSVTDSATDSSTKSTGVSKTSSEGPYWFAYVRIRLKRRKMQAELVMKDMVEDLTKAYNEGRKINDDRYDELVNLYSIMLGRYEDEGNNFIGSTADFKPLTDYVLQTMKKTVADFHAVADNLPDDVFKNRVRDINLKFDNQLSKSRVELITAGLFNSTVWTTTASGIERNREMALNDLIETKIDVYVKVTSAAGDIGTRFMDAAAKLQQMAKQRLLDPAETRNQVFKWMLDFMERRKDEFPGLDAIAGAAKSLGYSDTTTSNGVK